MVILARDHCAVVQALTAAGSKRNGYLSDSEDSDSNLDVLETEPYYEEPPPTLFSGLKVAIDRAKQKWNVLTHNVREHGEALFNKHYTPSLLPHKKKSNSNEYENDSEDEPLNSDLHLKPYNKEVFDEFGSAHEADKSVFKDCFERINKNEDVYKSILNVDVSTQTFKNVSDFLALVKQAVNKNLYDHLRYTQYGLEKTFDKEGNMNDYEFYSVYRTNSKHEHKSLTRIAHEDTGARLVTKLVVPTEKDFGSIDATNPLVVVGNVQDTYKFRELHSHLKPMFPHVYGVFGIEAKFTYEGREAVAMCSLVVMTDLTSFNHAGKIVFDAFVYDFKGVDSTVQKQIEDAFYAITDALNSKKLRRGFPFKDFAIVRHKHIISGAHSYKIYHNALEIKDLYQ